MSYWKGTFEVLTSSNEDSQGDLFKNLKIRPSNTYYILRKAKVFRDSNFSLGVGQKTSDHIPAKYNVSWSIYPNNVNSNLFEISPKSN